MGWGNRAPLLISATAGNKSVRSKFFGSIGLCPQEIPS